MENYLIEKGVNLEDFILTLGHKAWKTVGFDVIPSINEKEKEKITKVINAFDPFFGKRVRDHQVLVYIPRLDDLDAFSLKWWQRILIDNDLPLSVQFTDIYNISYFFNRLKVNPGWYLFTGKPIPGSTEKSWSQQRQLLREDYEIPNVNEILSFFILSHLGGIILDEKEVFARVVDPYYNVPLRIGQVIHKRVNVVCESSAQIAEDFVGIYAYKKII
jgi:hypothetical protein